MKPIIHGGARRGARLPEYGVWLGLRRRCLDVKDKSYPRYGARGITVCDEWVNSFENFYRDMGSRPTPTHSIERVDNDKGYSPENCVWATATAQAQNRRVAISRLYCIREHPLFGENLYITPKGARQCRTCRRDNCREWFRSHSSKKAVGA